MELPLPVQEPLVVVHRDNSLVVSGSTRQVGAEGRDFFRGLKYPFYELASHHLHVVSAWILSLVRGIRGELLVLNVARQLFWLGRSSGGGY